MKFTPKPSHAAATITALSTLICAATLTPAPVHAQTPPPAPAIQPEVPFGAFVPRVYDRFDKRQVALQFKQFLYNPWRYNPVPSVGPYLYQGANLDPFPIPANWTGDGNTCTVGTLSDAFVQSQVRQINYFRVLAGLSAVKVSGPDIRRKTVAAALMQMVNGSFFPDHNLPPTTPCYSADGAEGSARSDLTKTTGSSELGERYTVPGFIDDPGTENAAVGHRRDLFFPPQVDTAVALVGGSYPGGSGTGGAIWNGSNPAFGIPAPPVYENPEFVAWPSPGYFPASLLPNSQRWSFSCSGCDFSAASVSLMQDGQPLPPVVYERLLGGNFSNKTVVFKPQGAELWTRDAPDFPGFYDTIRAQRDVVFDVSVRNVKLPSGQSKDFSYRVITFDADLVAATLPTYHVGDLWWNEAEPGWGISISQGASGQLFGTWYTYRADGSAQWAVMSGGTWETPTRFTGTLYTTTGTPYDRLPFVSGQTAVTAAGSLTLEFSDASHGTMRYTLNGQSNTKAITRQPFSRGAETITDGRNFTGLWNDPAESGHGISLNMQYRTLFGVAYVYDQAGKSAWFTLPGCTWANETDCSGPIYTVTGPGGAVGGTFDPAQVRVTAAGSASVHFVDDYNATLTYTLNGFTATKTIKRYEF